MTAEGKADPSDEVAGRETAHAPGARLTEAKRVARRRARERRRELVGGRDLAADADRLARHVVALVALHTGGRVGCRVAAYESYGVEPPTDRLLAALEAAGHTVLLPQLQPDRSLQWVEHGSTTPLGQDELAHADVVVTPGLAVDRSRTRLGQGGGSYDRALVHRRPGALVVTLLHDGELGDVTGAPLPYGDLDLPVDGAVTADAGFVDLR